MVYDRIISPRLDNLDLLSMDEENSEQLLKDPTPAQDVFGNKKVEITIYHLIISTIYCISL